jgi:hypothetical protein
MSTRHQDDPRKRKWVAINSKCTLALGHSDKILGKEGLSVQMTLALGDRIRERESKYQSREVTGGDRSWRGWGSEEGSSGWERLCKKEEAQITRELRAGRAGGGEGGEEVLWSCLGFGEEDQRVDLPPAPAVPGQGSQVGPSGN